MGNVLPLVAAAVPLPVHRVVETAFASLQDRDWMATSLRARMVLEMAAGKGSNPASVGLFRASEPPRSVQDFGVKKKPFIL